MTHAVKIAVHVPFRWIDQSYYDARTFAGQAGPCRGRDLDCLDALGLILGLAGTLMTDVWKARDRRNPHDLGLRPASRVG